MKNIFGFLRVGAMAVVTYFAVKRGRGILTRLIGGSVETKNDSTRVTKDFQDAMRSVSRGELILAAKRFAGKIPGEKFETLVREHLVATGTPAGKADTEARDIRWKATA